VGFTENDEHRDLRAVVADIAGSYGPGYYAARAAARRPCAELWTALGRAAFLGVSIPEGFGGGGGGLTELVIVCEEIAAKGTPLLLLLVSAAISGEVIAKFGTDTPRKAWLPGLAAGTAKVVFAVTEPHAGSNCTDEAEGPAGGGADRPRGGGERGCPSSSCRRVRRALGGGHCRWTCCCPNASSR
jgi:alkylation response protein AidB-like acyl-CoA dehydrogenase